MTNLVGGGHDASHLAAVGTVKPNKDLFFALIRLAMSETSQKRSAHRIIPHILALSNEYSWNDPRRHNLHDNIMNDFFLNTTKSYYFRPSKIPYIFSPQTLHYTSTPPYFFPAIFTATSVASSKSSLGSPKTSFCNPLPLSKSPLPS